MATLHQRRTHPYYVEGCGPCKWSTLGYDGKHMTGITIVEEPMEVSIPLPSGEVVTRRTDRSKNEVTEHRDGRVDVNIKAPCVKLNARTKEVRN